MAQFGYDSIKKMQPRPGRSYATDYYKQNSDERARTERHITRVLEEFWEKAKPEPVWEYLNKPDQRFPRRETKGYYSPMEILTDMLEQMRSGKDIPSGMLGRWNKLLEGTGDEIDMVLYSELKIDSKFKELFDAS